MSGEFACAGDLTPRNEDLLYHFSPAHSQCGWRESRVKEHDGHGGRASQHVRQQKATRGEVYTRRRTSAYSSRVFDFLDFFFGEPSSSSRARFFSFLAFLRAARSSSVSPVASPSAPPAAFSDFRRSFFSFFSRFFRCSSVCAHGDRQYKLAEKKDKIGKRTSPSTSSATTIFSTPSSAPGAASTPVEMSVTLSAPVEYDAPLPFMSKRFCFSPPLSLACARREEKPAPASTAERGRELSVTREGRAKRSKVTHVAAGEPRA